MGVLVTGLESGLWNVIGFDGGGTTGWAVLSVRSSYFMFRGQTLVDNVAFWAAGQYMGPRPAQVAEAIALVEAWAPQYPGVGKGDWAPLDSLAVVAESFTLRQYRMDPTLLEPVRFNAAMEQELYNMRPRRRLAEQGPSMALGEVPDSKLRDIDAYAALDPAVRGGYLSATASRPHARDALRHCFTFAQREKIARRTPRNQGGGYTLVPLAPGEQTLTYDTALYGA